MLTTCFFGLLASSFCVLFGLFIYSHDFVFISRPLNAKWYAPTYRIGLLFSNEDENNNNNNEKQQLNSFDRIGLNLPYNQNGIIIFQSSTSSSLNRRTCNLVKGRRIIVTYASNSTYISLAERACKIAVTQPGIDFCLIVTPQFLDEKFKQQNAKILSQTRGAGYWLWKPYVILRLLLAISEQDVLFYMDADKTLMNGIEEFICAQAQLQQDVVVFYQDQPEYLWTKADAYLLMNVDNLPHVNDTMQIYGAYVLLRKSLDSVRFVSEWLTYCQDSRIIGDEPSIFRHETSEFFKDNRHDQTVLSLLAKKWDIPSWPNPQNPWPHVQTVNDDFGRPFSPFNQLDPNNGNYDKPNGLIIGNGS